MSESSLCIGSHYFKLFNEFYHTYLMLHHHSMEPEYCGSKADVGNYEIHSLDLTFNLNYAIFIDTEISDRLERVFKP